MDAYDKADLYYEPDPAEESTIKGYFLYSGAEELYHTFLNSMSFRSWLLNGFGSLPYREIMLDSVIKYIDDPNDDMRETDLRILQIGILSIGDVNYRPLW